VAFVGGINVEQGSMVSPGHRPWREGDNIHDVYLEVRGPSATDVHHNFVQRWNEASDRDLPHGCWPPQIKGGCARLLARKPGRWRPSGCSRLPGTESLAGAQVFATFQTRV
jgi:phosphatidylserine/phosphatidylglycerophosphate/cardiolipin synthase-like enzyme